MQRCLQTIDVNIYCVLAFSLLKVVFHPVNG